MHIEIYPKFTKIPEDYMYGKTVVVVDVLCSITAIIWAVKNGSGNIIPTRDAAEAVAMFGKLGSPDCILAGEYNGEMLPDFHLGCSPFEFTESAVKDKPIIIAANGTAAICGTSAAKRVLLGGFINRTAVAKKILEYNDDVIFVCAGSNGEISADDLCGSGAIINSIHNLANKQKRTDVTESDMSFVCRALYMDCRSKSIDLQCTEIYKKMIMAGRADVVKFCFSPDATDVVPEYRNGVIS